MIRITNKKKDRKDKKDMVQKETLAVFSRFHTVSAAMLALSQLEKEYFVIPFKFEQLITIKYWTGK